MTTRNLKTISISSTVVALLAACAATGTQIQSACEKQFESISDIVICTKSTLAQKNPAKLEDPKAKLYLLRGEQLGADVQAGRMSNLEARVAWQKLYVQLWEESPAEQAAKAQMLGRLLQQQAQQNAESGYKIVQPANLQQNAVPTVISQQAFWTGKSQPATSITGVAGFNCEYQYAGQRFWRMQPGACPSSVDVR